jgi:hypothetical protein
MATRSGGGTRGRASIGANEGVFRDPRTITAPPTPHKEARHTLMQRGQGAKAKRFIPQDKKRDNLNPSF